MQHLELRLQLRLGEQSEDREAGIVNQHLDGHRRGADFLINLVHGRRSGEIPGNDERLDSKFALQPRGELGELVVAPRHQDAVEAILCAQQRELVTDSARGSRDQRRLAQANTFSPARIGTASQFSRGASGQAQRAS